MKSVTSRLIRSLVGIAICIALLPAAFAENNFVPVRLPHGVQLELPRNWEALSNNQRVTIDSAVQALGERAGIFDASYDYNFAANCYDDAGKTIALMNVRYYPEGDLSQAEVRAFTQADIHDFDSALRETMTSKGPAAGYTILTWSGTKKQIINGITAIVVEYKRSSLNGIGTVRLVKVFNNKKTFTLTVSYHEEHEQLLRPICDRIISSLRN